ncbi:phosphoglycolate phosphatase-like protein [Methylophaga frappieri]|uniref:Phosphoglycolate phosphatase-like protein n=2 Tax=Methylophaga frappieri (strain ATCC BAA-2434 / DSM 25690 / JAM7) TaxID=754477 RepID=I1YHQ4_METFJ|nr:phosphoglycolate phosphatase-like protein [Methylophaga frappieri]
MDSTGHIVFCMREAIAQLKLPPKRDAEISHIIGLGLPEAVLTLYPDSSPAAVQQLADSYRRIWLNHPYQAPLFENAQALLNRLSRQCFLGVATGKSRRGLNKVLAETGLGPLFTQTRCADESFSKPHPQMLTEIIDFCGVSPAETLMIGDTVFDLQMATNAGADCLAISHGAHPSAQLQSCDPLAILPDLHALESWLDSSVAVI